MKTRQEGRPREVREGSQFINTLLLVIAGVAVFVGAFLIQNTFRIIVAQRTGVGIAACRRRNRTQVAVRW